MGQGERRGGITRLKKRTMTKLTRVKSAVREDE